MSGLILIALMALTAESRIDSVIVYTDQVEVIRRASVAISGSEQIRFPELTGMLDDNSIRIRAPGLHIGEVRVIPGYTAQPTGRVKTLQDSLDRLTEQDKLMSNEQEVGKAREAFLNSIKLGAPELISKELTTGRIDVPAWGSALNFLSAELAAVKRRAMELDKARKELAKVISAVTQELNAARAQQENRKTIVVEAVASQSGNYHLLLSYRVPYSVSWSPYYEARALPADRQVKLSYYARLQQRTNEDWDGVKVILSTAQPSSGGVAPEPQPWYLNIWEPMPAEMGKSARPMKAPGAPDMLMEERSVAESEIALPPVETGISLRYVVPGRVTLKSGEEPQKLFLHEAKLPAEFSYYSYPRIQELAYLRGRFLNSSDYIFLSGQGSTYVGEEFTGKTWLLNIAPGESAILSFGVDDRVKIKRELVKTFTSKTGLLGNRTRIDFVYRTTIENYHSKADSITLIEQIPVSQNKEITVNIVRIEPKPIEENRNLGTYTFRLNLPPQQKVVIDLAYYVEHPTGKKVSGLY